MLTHICMRLLTLTLSRAKLIITVHMHVVQNKCCVLQENVVSKQLTLYDQETISCSLQSVYCLDKQSDFSIASGAQYCSVAHERVKQIPLNGNTSCIAS